MKTYQQFREELSASAKFKIGPGTPNLKVPTGVSNALSNLKTGSSLNTSTGSGPSTKLSGSGNINLSGSTKPTPSPKPVPPSSSTSRPKPKPTPPSRPTETIRPTRSF